MRYAIDRYEIGTEREVCADEFYGKFIPRRQSRFFCPECGEPVFWRSRGGAHPNQFCHHIRTTQAPECEKRVDGRSGLNLYERIGLPIYISQINGQYQINIGFPALGDSLLDRASSSQTRVIISGGGLERSVAVNQTNFFGLTTTLIPINFIPYPGKNYVIEFQGAKGSDDLQKKWSDYADGFDIGGALFSSEETGGKKIRRGDSISPGRDYLVISKNFSPSLPELVIQKMSAMKLGDSLFGVYQMEINVSTDSQKRYAVVSNYIKSMFGVWLIETPPELIPLWPPVVVQNDLLPVMNISRIFCGLSSGNVKPSVFLYTGSAVTTLPVQHCNTFTVEIPMSSQTVTLSVDRKYVGRELNFTNIPIAASDYEYHLHAKKADGTSIEFSNMSLNELSDELFIEANAKMDLYVGSNDRTYRRIPLREGHTIVPARRNSREMFIFIENCVFEHFSTVKEPAFFSVEDNAALSIQKQMHGALIPAPPWVLYIMTSCLRLGYAPIAEAIGHTISNGKIHIGVVCYLYKNYLSQLKRLD